MKILHLRFTAKFWMKKKKSFQLVQSDSKIAVRKSTEREKECN